MQSAAQFTPEQLIVAGRRAETQGQTGYALQFYRYLAEKYPNTTEAYEARDALFRLHGSESLATPPPANQPSQAAQRPTAQPRARPPAPPEVPQAPSRSQSALLSVPTTDNAVQHVDRRGRRSTSRHEPEVQSSPGYRTGRFVAAILSTLGWLLLLSSVLGAVGTVALLAVKAAPKALHDLATANLLIVVGGLAASFLLGLLCVFAGQVARATFDTADTTRWLASSLAHDHTDHH